MRLFVGEKLEGRAISMCRATKGSDTS